MEQVRPREREAAKVVPPAQPLLCQGADLPQLRLRKAQKQGLAGSLFHRNIRKEERNSCLSLPRIPSSDLPGVAAIQAPVLAPVASFSIHVLGAALGARLLRRAGHDLGLQVPSGRRVRSEILQVGLLQGVAHGPNPRLKRTEQRRR